MRELFANALLFCGACLTRRVLGIAHNIDLEQIDDLQKRANCEARVLNLSALLLTEATSCATVSDLVALVERLHADKDTF